MSLGNVGNLGKTLIGTASASILLVLITLVSGVLIARVLGPELRGTYGAIMLVAQTAAAVGSFSFFDACVVKLRERSSSAELMLPSMIISVVLISIAAVVGTISIIWIVEEYSQYMKYYTNIFDVIFISSVIVLCIISDCFLALEKARLRFNIINIDRLLPPLIFALALVVFWLIGGVQLRSVLLFFLAGKIVQTVIWLVRYRGKLVGSISKPFLFSSLRTGLKFHLAFALNVVSAQIDRLFLIVTWSADLLGQYFVAFASVGAGFSVLSSAMTLTLLPILSGLEKEQRKSKIAQIIRLTFILDIGVIALLWFGLPFVIPMMYGLDYRAAVDMALGLSLAMALVPIRIIVFEAGRSLGKGRPAVEMAIASIGVFSLGYLVSGFAFPNYLFMTMGAANIVSIAVGARHMMRDGDIALDGSLVPGWADIKFLLLQIKPILSISGRRQERQ